MFAVQQNSPWKLSPEFAPRRGRILIRTNVKIPLGIFVTVCAAWPVSTSCRGPAVSSRSSIVYQPASCTRLPIHRIRCRCGPLPPAEGSSRTSIREKNSACPRPILHITRSLAGDNLVGPMHQTAPHPKDQDFRP